MQFYLRVIIRILLINLYLHTYWTTKFIIKDSRLRLRSISWFQSTHICSRLQSVHSFFYVLIEISLSLPWKIFICMHTDTCTQKKLKIWIGTPKSQEIPTQTRPKVPKKSQKSQKSQNFENCSQTWPKNPIILVLVWVGIFRSNLRFFGSS